MRKYWALYRTALQGVLAYRGSMFFWMLGNILSLLAITSVWLSTSNTGLIATYHKDELITYYILSTTLWWISGWAPSSWIKKEIKDGVIIGKNLLKPTSFYFRVYFEEAAWHSISIFVGLGVAFLFWFFLKDYFTFQLTLGGILIVFLAVLSSVFVICTFSICLGLLAFWFTEITTIEAVFWAAMSLLGGSIVPLSFIPSNFQGIVKLLPFRYMTSFPLEIYFHKLNTWEIFIGFVIQLFWIVALTLLYKVMWIKGVKNYKSWGQ